jgi:hypothetical protein
MTVELAKTLAEIMKIGETDPKAADAALQSLRCGREAGASEAETPSDLESLEHLLGDLEAGAGESTAEVIEHLDDLSANSESATKALDSARVAAMLAAFGATKAPATPTVPAVAVAEKAERTDIEDFDFDLGDLETLNACIEGTARAKAVEAALAGLGADELDASAEDTPKAEGSVVATFAEAAVTEEAERTEIDLNLVLADLEVGAGETSEVVEHLGELDASAEDAVEGAIAVVEAYEDQPDAVASFGVGPTARTIAIQTYLAKQPKRGGARPAACKEFGVDPTDPLAEDKVRVAGVLKKFKATLADLEAFWPGYWTLPRKTEGKDDKGEPFPSRALVLKKFEWRRYNEITSAERKKLKESARLKKREAKIVAKGWRADFYDLSPADQKRERDRVWRQNKRTG